MNEIRESGSCPKWLVLLEEHKRTMFPNTLILDYNFSADNDWFLDEIPSIPEESPLFLDLKRSPGYSELDDYISMDDYEEFWRLNVYFEEGINRKGERKIYLATPAFRIQEYALWEALAMKYNNQTELLREVDRLENRLRYIHQRIAESMYEEYRDSVYYEQSMQKLFEENLISKGSLHQDFLDWIENNPWDVPYGINKIPRENPLSEYADTVEELAEKTGITPSVVFKYAQGTISQLSDYVRHKLTQTEIDYQLQARYLHFSHSYDLAWSPNR